MSSPRGSRSSSPSNAVVGDEDTALVEAAQRGSSAGMIEHGWVLGGTETLIGRFQDYVRGRLGVAGA